jgi:hypothetical protein
MSWVPVGVRTHSPLANFSSISLSFSSFSSAIRVISSNRARLFSSMLRSNCDLPTCNMPIFCSSRSCCILCCSSFSIFSLNARAGSLYLDSVSGSANHSSYWIRFASLSAHSSAARASSMGYLSRSHSNPFNATSRFTCVYCFPRLSTP